MDETEHGSTWTSEEWLEVRRSLEDRMWLAKLHQDEDPYWPERVASLIGHVDAILCRMKARR